MEVDRRFELQVNRKERQTLESTGVTVTAIYRYTVKGLSAEQVDSSG